MSLYNNINKTDNMENDLTRLTSAPGFRFHPTDEELVSYYLRRKLYGKGFRLDAISEVDVYKSEPWDLPGRSKLKTKDLEWYFFSALDKKYGNGVRTNRATEKGYWKTTGKDRAISHKSHLAGMKKTLVYHHGRAPKGQRTNWVMHEYRLIDEKLARAGVSQHCKLNSASSTVEDPYPWKSDAFVLCRIFQKSGPGPKNGEKYGAPLVDEEWEEDELFLSSSKEVVEGTVEDHDIYLDSNDLEQIFGTADNIPQPLNIDYGDSNVQVQKTPLEDSYPAPEKELQNPVLQLENQMVNKPLNQELAVGETSNTANDLDFLFDQEFFDALSNEPLDDAAFLENDDLFNMGKVDPSGMGMLDGYLNYFNEDQGFDYSNMFGSENLAAGQSFFNPELVDGGAKQEIMENHQLLQGNNKDDAFVSKPLTENVGSGGKYAFIEKASHMLGGISAPPALASEFPSKESALRLISASNPSVHLTAGMIQTKKLKSDIDVSFFLSFGVSHTDADNSLAKDTSAVSRSIMYFMFFSVLIISVTYRMGSWFFSGNISS